jgi:hypothetical protein
VAVLHQSDVSSWMRCPTQFKYSRQGLPRKQTSALAYGSVMHHALEALTRMRVEGVPFETAVQRAVETFDFYWNPINIEPICDPVQLWLRGQSFSGLRQRGMTALREYAELTKYDEHEQLATEFSFRVPIDGTWDEDTGSPHVLAGTIDKLAVRYYSRHETVCVDDFKTGKEYAFLRQNLQFTAYCYATTRPEFWTGWEGEAGFGKQMGEHLYDRLREAPRRGTWINLKQIKIQDAGWRGPQDYRRFAIAVEQIVASMKADIYPLNLSGDTCQFCEYRAICTGTGVPGNDHGAPTGL